MDHQRNWGSMSYWLIQIDRSAGTCVPLHKSRKIFTRYSHTNMLHTNLYSYELFLTCERIASGTLYPRSMITASTCSHVATRLYRFLYILGCITRERNTITHLMHVSSHGLEYGTSIIWSAETVRCQRLLCSPWPHVCHIDGIQCQTSFLIGVIIGPGILTISNARSLRPPESFYCSTYVFNRLSESISIDAYPRPLITTGKTWSARSSIVR